MRNHLRQRGPMGSDSPNPGVTDMNVGTDSRNSPENEKVQYAAYTHHMDGVCSAMYVSADGAGQVLT